jgi:hypothetical protein
MILELPLPTLLLLAEPAEFKGKMLAEGGDVIGNEKVVGDFGLRSA